MTDVRERKRAKVEVDSDIDRHEEAKVSRSTRMARRSRLLYLLSFVGVVLFVYTFPDFFKALLEPWIEFREPSLHGVSSDPVVSFSVDSQKRDAVVAAFKHAWLAYERDAMGDDEYRPIEQKGTNLSESGGVGYTVVDSVDTMLLMGLTDEAARAKDWIANKLTFEREGNFNTFETTIRILGGLLSAYHLSGQDPVYLEKAVDLANRLLPVFDTPSGLPLSSVNLAQRKGIPDSDSNGWVSTAEVATLQLEFKYLSSVTEDDTYWRVVEKVMEVIKRNNATPHLVSIYMNPETGQFVPSDIRLGSRGDSYYEYLLKQWLQTSKSETVYRQMYQESMDAVNAHLVQQTPTSGFMYTAELRPERTATGASWRLVPKQDHLVCFLGGSLMLGATTSGSLVEQVSVPPRYGELSPEGRRDWRVGVELIRTCMETHNTATGLSPEIVHFRTANDGLDSNGMVPRDWYIKGARLGASPPLDARYILRPETVESLFIAYRLTGDEKYRDYGWNIFQAIEKHCKIETGGYASVLNVDELPVQHEDKMETFMMSETLKYLFLLFSDKDIVPLSEYVFNTEAHPLPIFKPSFRTGFS